MISCYPQWRAKGTTWRCTRCTRRSAQSPPLPIRITECRPRPPQVSVLPVISATSLSNPESSLNVSIPSLFGSSHDIQWQEQVCELWVGARTLSRHGHLHQLQRTGAHPRHLQSGNVRLAHVPPLHPVRVGRTKCHYSYRNAYIHVQRTIKGEKTTTGVIKKDYKEKLRNEWINELTNQSINRIH